LLWLPSVCIFALWLPSVASSYYCVVVTKHNNSESEAK
jgi:hypothetical protein